MAAAPHVELVDVSKRFGGTEALRHVSLTIRRGTVHALVGENGAGKSTLGKILAGVFRPDSGLVRVDGRTVNFSSPSDAAKHGIAIIHQELSLVPQLTVLENVFLGVERLAQGREETVEIQFAGLCRRVGFELPPNARVRDLNAADRQKVEILRALARDARLIIMDEPTARLGAAEVERLLATVAELRAQGVTVVYVSHFLREVLRVADVVTVLRNGEVVLTEPSDKVSLDDVVTAMLGRALSRVFPKKPPVAPEARSVLSVEGLTRPGAFDQVSLHVREGEIVGLFGLVGSGRTELARAVIGAEPYASGEIELNGSPVRFTHPSQAVRCGLFYVPESRSEQGLHLELSVRANLSLPHLGTLSRLGVVEQRRERAAAIQMIERLGIVPPNSESRVRTLSGGNQQKVLLGKWLIRRPKALILDEPTRGVDVGAKTGIYGLIAQLCSEGIGMLLISSELEEILGLSHRVLVMRQGRIVGEFLQGEASEEAVLRAALGS